MDAIRRMARAHSVKPLEDRTRLSGNYLFLRPTRRSGYEDMQHAAFIKCFLVPLIMCYYLTTNQPTLAQESPDSMADPLASFASETNVAELSKTMIRSADGELHLVISQPQAAVPFSPDEHLFTTSNLAEHLSSASEHHPTTQNTVNYTMNGTPENSSNSQNSKSVEPNQFISVLNNQSNIVFSVAQTSDGSPQRQLVGELADKTQSTLASRYKWSLYDSRGVDSSDGRPHTDSNNNSSNSVAPSATSNTQTTPTPSSNERKPMKEQHSAGPKKRANVMMISYTTMKPASYKVSSSSSTTLATPVAKVSGKPVASLTSSSSSSSPPRITPHFFGPLTNGAQHSSTSAFYNAHIHSSLAEPTEAPSGGFTTHFRPTMLLHGWPGTSADYSLDGAANQVGAGELDSNELFSVLASGDADDQHDDESAAHHSQIHARSPKESSASLEEFLRAAASSQSGQQEEIQQQQQHQPASVAGELVVGGTNQLLHSHHEPMLADTRLPPETNSLIELSHAHKPASSSVSLSKATKTTNVIDQPPELMANSREVALETATDNNRHHREPTGRKQQHTKEPTGGRQSIKHQQHQPPATSGKKRKTTATNNAKETASASASATADRELLVGPFKSESDAPATITLSGVVYQKSGSSSSILHRQVKQQQQQQQPQHTSGLRQPRIATAASSSLSAAASLTEEGPPPEGPLDLMLDNGEARELQLSLDSSSSGSFGHQNPSHHFFGASSSPYPSGGPGSSSLSRLTTDAALAELILSAALKSSRQPGAELSMEGAGESLLAQLEATAGQHQRGPKESSFMATPDASFSLDELQQQQQHHQPQAAQHQFQQLTLDSVSQPFGGGGGAEAGPQQADDLQSVVEDQLDQLAEHGGKLSAGQQLKPPKASTSSSMLIAEALSAAAAKQHLQQQQQHSDSASLQQIAKEIQQSFYHQPTSGAGPKTSNFGLQVADDDQQFFTGGQKLASAANQQQQHQMLLSSDAGSDEELQLAAASSEGRKKRPHGPIVIVQKDVKPVKYHLLRAYLALRRFIRPFEAAYVFPPDPFGPVASSLLGRRHQQQHRPILGGGAGPFMGAATSPAFSSVFHRQMGAPSSPLKRDHSQLLEQLATYHQSMKSAPLDIASRLAGGAAAEPRRLAKLGPQRVHQHPGQHQHQQPHQRLIQQAAAQSDVAGQAQVQQRGRPQALGWPSKLAGEPSVVATNRVASRASDSPPSSQ